MSSATDRTRRWVALALGLLTLVLYARTGGHGFILLDDAEYVRLNPVVRQGLTWEGVRWAFTTGHISNWHPLTWLSHQLDVTLFGLNPGAFHLVNAGFHAVNAVLLFLLFLRLTGALWPSAFVGAMFAWHPLHVESVAWIAERKDVLSTLFLLLTLWAYAAYAARPGVGRYLVVFTCLALGLMSKPMLVTTPCLMLLLDAWPLGRVRQARDWGRLVAEKLPLFALVAASCVVTFLAQQGGRAVVSMEVFPLSVRLANAVVAAGEYLLKTVWPVNLAVFYPHPGLRPWWQVGLALAGLGAVTALALAQARRRPFLAVGWFWYLGTLMPVIGLVQVGDQALADRYTYVPLIGVSLMLAWGGADLARRPGLAASVSAAAAIACALWYACSGVQLRHWRNDETLFTHARAATRNNYLAETIVGSMLLGRGQVEPARQSYANALRVRPAYPKALSGMGDVLAAQRRPTEALEFYRQALRWGPQLSDTHNAAGAVLSGLERWEEALGHFAEAVRIEPGFAEAEFNRALALQRLGRLEDSAGAYERAAAWRPGNLPARLGLADVRVAQSRDQDALALLQPWLQADPNAVEALHRVAWIRATSHEPALRDGAEAVILAARASEQTGQQHAPSLIALAAAYAESGRFEDAVRTFQKAEARVVGAGALVDKDLGDRLSRLKPALDARRAYHRAPRP